MKSNEKKYTKPLRIVAEHQYDCQHNKRIRQHYAYARLKHPAFCNWILPRKTTKDIKDKIAYNLTRVRERIAVAEEKGVLGWDDILDCQMWKVFDALAKGDNDKAVKTMYKMIAVILRTIDVVEGRQKLKKVEESKKRE